LCRQPNITAKEVRETEWVAINPGFEQLIGPKTRTKHSIYPGDRAKFLERNSEVMSRGEIAKTDMTM